ncbi:hypothetical protein ABID37_003737 [Aquamicrobium terrae]|uniref:Transposase n=1 Tax=Aquamicrobium terrae TaxID=1324945 RepID=A0ABV2N371_9HYPH
MEKAFSGWRDQDRCRGPLEELDAEIFFDDPNLNGQRGLRDMAALGGLAEMTAFGKGDDIFELAQGWSERHG